jgi:site-specific DNA recombinase
MIACIRIALYVRVSTSHQVERQTIEQQLGLLNDHVRAHAADGWALEPRHVFRDDGCSGASLARPGLDRLRDAAKAREIDRVLITAPDRLVRNYVHQMVLIEELSRVGCAVEFLDRPMSNDPHDQLLLQIRGAVAEYERTLIAERMRRGRLTKMRAGLLLPWTHAPYGYRVDPDRPRDPAAVRVEPAEAAIVAELFAQYREPVVSLAQLAVRLTKTGVLTPFGRTRWSSATVRGILRNPTYTGLLYGQRTRYRPATHRRSAIAPLGQPHGTAMPLPVSEWLLIGQVPALVSQAHFDEVQMKLSQNRAFARRNNTAHSYLLRALVSCGCCGLACTARATNGKHFYYLCNGKSQPVHSHRATRCPARFTPAAQLDELVWADLCALLANRRSLAAAFEQANGGAWLPQELQARQDNLRHGQAHLRRQLERLTEAYLDTVVPLQEYQRRRHDLEQRIEALAAQERQLGSDADRQREIAGIAASLEEFRRRVSKSLVSATFEQRRQLVMLLVDRVVVTGADVEIRYVLPTTPESEHVRFCQLRKDYFEHPAPRQQHEALLGLGQLDHAQLDAVLGGVLPGLLARVALVGPGEFDRLAGDLLHCATAGSHAAKAASPPLLGRSSAAHRRRRASCAGLALPRRLLHQHQVRRCKPPFLVAAIRVVGLS